MGIEDKFICTDLAASIRIAKEFKDDPYLASLYKAGGSDGTVDFQDLAGKQVGEFLIDSPHAHSQIADAVQRYQELVGRQSEVDPTRLVDPAALWWAVSKDKTLNTPSTQVAQLSPLFQDNKITIPYVYSDNFSTYGVFELSENPAESCLISREGFRVPMDQWSLEVHILFYYLVSGLNNRFQANTSDPITQNYRRILLKNGDAAAPYFARELPRDSVDFCTMVSKLVDYGAAAFIQKGISVDRMPNKLLIHTEIGPVLIGKKQPILEGEAQRILEMISALPVGLKSFLKSKSSFEEVFKIILMEESEYRLISLEGVAIYVPFNHLMLLPISLLAQRAGLDLASVIEHEFNHLSHDVMTPNTYYEAIGSSIGAGFMEYIGEPIANLLSDPYKPAAFLGVSVAAIAGGFISAFLAIKAVIVGKLAAWILLGASSVLGLGIVGEEHERLSVNSEGLMKEEFDRLTRKPGDAYQLTVSQYARLNVAEFAAETQLAYFNPEAEIWRSGNYYPAPDHGLKTREELIEKHPALFLAFEAFFAEDSPLKYNPIIFKEEIYPMIYAILDANPDVYLARAEFFEELLKKRESLSLK